MPSETLSFKTRIKTLEAVLTTADDLAALRKAQRKAKGNLPAALESLRGKVPDTALQRVNLAHSLADWSDDHVAVVKGLFERAEIKELRDVALNFNVDKLATLVDQKAVPTNTLGKLKGPALNISQSVDERFEGCMARCRSSPASSD